MLNITDGVKTRSLLSDITSFHGYNNFIQLLSSYATRYADYSAVTILRGGSETHFTYSHLLQRATKVAGYISKITKPGDRVLLLIPTSEEFIDFFFGCMLAARIAVPLPVEKKSSRFSRVKNVAADCCPALAVFRTRSDFVQMQEHFEGVEIVVVEEIQGCLEDSCADYEICDVPPEQAAFIQYTSGSTGNPKGVLITHQNLISNINMIVEGMRLSEADRVVSWLPLHHDLGLVGMLLSTLAARARPYIFPPEEFARNPISWLTITSQAEGTLTGAPNFAFDLIVRRSHQILAQMPDLSKLRVLYSGSERISEKVVQNFYHLLRPAGLRSSTFFTCYGMAEASVYVTGNFKDVAAPLSPTASPRGTYPSCGVLARGLRLQIVDDRKSEVLQGATGEIEISGPSISPGYWQDLKEQVTGGVFHGSSQEWLPTGDLGFVFGNELVITGRSKDTIKVRGHNVYPDDVELPLESEIRDWLSPNSVVAISTDSSDGTREELTLVAEIDRQRRNDSFTKLLNKVQAVLFKQDLRCDRLIVLSPLSLPKTSSGKKQRRLTARILKEGGLKVLWDSATQRKTEVVDNVYVASALHENQEFEGLAALRSYFDSVNMVLADERRCFPSDLVGTLARLGFLGLLVPRAFGGRGLTHAEFTAVAQELGKIDLSLAAMVGIQNTIGILPILYSDVLPDRATVLRSIASRGDVVSFALTEPEAGSNPRAIVTEARRVDGTIRLTGEKVWIGNAPFASFINVFAREFDESGNEIGVSGFLVRKGIHEFAVGEEQLTVGVRSMPQNRITFYDSELHDHDRLTKPGQGFPLAFRAMEYARFGLSAVATGAVKSAMGQTVSYSTERQIATGLLFENAYFRTVMAQHFLRLRSLESLVRTAALKLDGGLDLPQAVSLTCKIVAGEWASSIVDKCLQFSGGRGYTETFGVGRIWRDIRVLRIFEGPTETVAAFLGHLIIRRPDTLKELCDWLEIDAGINSAVNEILEEIKAEVRNPQTPLDVLNVTVGLLVAQFVTLSALRINADDASMELEAILAMKVSLLREFRSTLIEHTLLKESFIALAADRVHVAPRRRERALFDTWNGQYRIDHGMHKISITPGNASLSEQIRTPSELPVELLDDVREAMTAWFSTQAKCAHVDGSRSISETGIDSLLAFELVCFVEERFKFKLPETSLSQDPTIDDLCAEIALHRYQELRSV